MRAGGTLARGARSRFAPLLQRGVPRRVASRSLLVAPRCASSRVCSSYSKKVPASSSSLAEAAQIDSGFWQGLTVLGGIAALSVVPGDTKRATTVSAIATYRRLGLDPALIGDRRLVDDFIRTNIVALANVLLASPTFYFMWHLIHQQSVANSLMRGVTGTVRIAPFMVIFHSLFAIGLPFFTAELMRRSPEEGYKAAKGNASKYMLLSGFVAIEAVVELRGCGVQFNQMPISGFTLFIPALVGRLATGALTQYQKLGEEFVNVLPAAWGERDAAVWQRKTNDVFNYFCVDEAFFYTLLGTSFFQHVLNGITFVMLTKCKAAGMKDYGNYIVFGLEGSVLSGLQQFGRTLMMRFAFCTSWNWLSSQPRQLAFLDAAVAQLEAKR